MQLLEHGAESISTSLMQLQKSGTYMVNRPVLENRVPALLISKVCYSDNLQMVLPFRMEREDGLGDALSANGAGDFVARGDESVDDMCACKED
jgi:hypothetical protein